METIESLKQLQQRLRDSDQQSARELFDYLLQIQVTFQLLKDTKIGKTVKRISGKFPSLRIKGKMIIDKWKTLIPARNPHIHPVSADQRQQKFVQIFTKILDSRQLAQSIQESLNNHIKPEQQPAKIRSLRSNLTKNASLKQNVIQGLISTDTLVKMGPRELASQQVKKEREKIEKEQIDSRRSDWHLANTNIKEGLFRCAKCGSMKTIKHQMQTRSADEPMTTQVLFRFVKCVDCSHSWKF